MVPGGMNVIRNEHRAQVRVVADDAYVARKREVQPRAHSGATDRRDGSERTSVQGFKDPVNGAEILQRVWCAAGDSLQQGDVGPRAEGLSRSGQNERAVARPTDAFYGRGQFARHGSCERVPSLKRIQPNDSHAVRPGFDLDLRPSTHSRCYPNASVRWNGSRRSTAT